MSCRLTRKAAEDIRRIYRSGEMRFGQRQAEAYHINLERTLELLASNPKLARQRLEIMPPVRGHPFGAHLVIYQDLADQDILVIRICHGHEDWQARRD